MTSRIDNFHDKRYEFLSNFSDSPIEYEGIRYPTVEHAFQAAKSLSPADRRRIASLPYPRLAKKEGRRVKLRPNWDQLKDGIMLQLLRLKFAPGSVLAEKLLATGDAELIEGNTWHDNHFGNCVCPKHRGIPGENVLGKSLMQIRQELKAISGR